MSESTTAAPRVLLISAPWRSPIAPGLALATLSPILSAAGIAADTLHGSTLFPYSPTESGFLESYSSYLFVPHLYPDVDRERLVDAILQRFLDELNVYGLRYDSEMVTLAQLGANAALKRRNTLADMDRAGQCIQRIVDRACSRSYDVVGISATFEQQLPAALAIARRIKARAPQIRVALGGAACFEELGDGLARAFPVFDAICHTEGERVLVPLIEALRGRRALADVPGITFRAADGSVRHNPSPPTIRQLDELPIPDYHSYFVQLAESEWTGVGRVKLFFETSRGCWWGEKHFCTFCGLNPEGLIYRHKSSERAYQEMEALYRRYPGAAVLQATDNILEMSFIKEVLPRLAAGVRDPARPLQTFWMLKSNLRREQLETLARSGMAGVQPGLESLHDEILRNMDKGVTGIGQVQFIKWAHEVGLSLIYNIIISNPGDQAAWYREMTAMIAYIEHLPPPSGITPMMLDRFSTYHTHPERYGITNVRARRHYADIYRDPDVDIESIAYIFEYDHEMHHDEELREAQRVFLHRAYRWKSWWRPGRAYCVDRTDGIFIADDRQGDQRVGVNTGVAARLFRAIDRARPIAALHRALPDLEADVLQSQLDTWIHSRWAFASGDRYLSVIPTFDRPSTASPEAALPAAPGP